MQQHGQTIRARAPSNGLRSEPRPAPDGVPALRTGFG